MTFVLILLNLVFGVLCIRHFDAAVRWVHSHEHSLWESLGSPPGFLWVPADSGWWRGALARQQFVTQFFFGGAPWIRASLELRRFRRAYLFCWLAIMLIVALALTLNA